MRERHSHGARPPTPTGRGVKTSPSTASSTHLGVLVNGFHNVSRWMTWLPISLKNAAKCDKWYQLQNHPITESLNAKGAREKLFTSEPRACRNLSVEQKTILEKRVSVFSCAPPGSNPKAVAASLGGCSELNAYAVKRVRAILRHKWATQSEK